jgi:hypothetical protein
LNAIYRHLNKKRDSSSMKWSVVDRWPIHKGLVKVSPPLPTTYICRFSVSKFSALLG